LSLTPPPDSPDPLPSPAPLAPAPAPRRGHPLRKWSPIAAGIILLLLVGAFLMVRHTPSWYVPLDPTSDHVLDEADVAQNKVALELHNAVQRVPLGDQKWTITQDEINSLLAIRFSNAAPDKAGSLPISGPLIIFSGGEVRLAVRTTKIPSGNAAGGVASIVFAVTTTTDAAGEPIGLIKITGVYAGSLPIPKSLVEERMRRAVPTIAAVAHQTITYQLGVRDSASMMPQIETAIHAVAEGEPFPLKFVADHREVLVKEIHIDDGILTIVLGPPPAPLPGAIILPSPIILPSATTLPGATISPRAPASPRVSTSSGTTTLPRSTTLKLRPPLLLRPGGL
jgi:hypothetical protein